MERTASFARRGYIEGLPYGDEPEEAPVTLLCPGALLLDASMATVASTSGVELSSRATPAGSAIASPRIFDVQSGAGGAPSTVPPMSCCGSLPIPSPGSSVELQRAYSLPTAAVLGGRKGVSGPSRSEQAFAEVQELLSSILGASTDGDSNAPGPPAAAAALLARVKLLCGAADSLQAKERENENLVQVLKEMSCARAEANRQRMLAMESYFGLQAEYERLHKSNSLTQSVSRTNLDRSQRLRQELQDSQQELRRARKQITELQACNGSLRGENRALREELRAAERLALMADCRTSVCLKQYSQPVGLY